MNISNKPCPYHTDMAEKLINWLKKCCRKKQQNQINLISANIQRTQVSIL